MQSLRPRHDGPPNAATPSLALGVAITGALFAAAVVAGTQAPAAWLERARVGSTTERVVYVAPRVAPPNVEVTTPAPRTRRASNAATTPPTSTTRADALGGALAPGTATGTGNAPAGRADTAAGGSRAAPSPRATSTTAPATAPATARGAQPGPTGGSLRVGIERPEPPPLTRPQMDSALRDKAARLAGDLDALAEAARFAKDAGERRDDQTRRDLTRGVSGGSPTYRGIGATFGIGLPLGGPSAADRKRAAAVDSVTRATLERAAERRRAQLQQLRADSLRRSRDSLPRSPS